MRIITVEQYLADRYLANCETNSRRQEDGSDNMLVLAEILANFDPTVQENVRRITTEE
jgi:hypothetical protein